MLMPKKVTSEAATRPDGGEGVAGVRRVVRRLRTQGLEPCWMTARQIEARASR